MSTSQYEEQVEAREKWEERKGNFIRGLYVSSDSDILKEVAEMLWIITNPKP